MMIISCPKCGAKREVDPLNRQMSNLCGACRPKQKPNKQYAGGKPTPPKLPMRKRP